MSEMRTVKRLRTYILLPQAHAVCQNLERHVEVIRVDLALQGKGVEMLEDTEGAKRCRDAQCGRIKL